MNHMEWTEELLDKLQSIFEKKWRSFGYDQDFEHPKRTKEWDKFCSKNKITQIISTSDNKAWTHWLNIGSRDHIVISNPNNQVRSEWMAIPMDFAEKCLILGVI